MQGGQPGQNPGQGQGQYSGQNPGQRGGRNRNRNRNRNRGGRRGRQQPQAPLQRTEAEVEFLNKTPITPNEWIQFEKGSDEHAMRAVDFLCPVGKGTRGLIVSPPKVGKTTILKQICNAVEKADKDMRVLCVLIDERPEEVTDFRRAVNAEIFASSSDAGFQEHIKMAQRVYQEAVATAAAGKDVMIVLDSLTRLARAFNTAATGTKTLSGGLDSNAMEWPRRFFGAARKLEEGGSITILATILVDTNSRMDEVIFQEFKGTGNMELVLSRQAAEMRIFPAIHVKNSGTRREELLLPKDALEKVWLLRRKLAIASDMEATKTVVDLLKRNPTNEKLLAGIQGSL
ncbi:MAG: transcription termination factor Rho [Elusimicrobia bacterium CG1_02_63_36]|nr:MAG: transcription termination factor Rho [Elusimicrobia bacterium CG1_02_63_36]